MQAFLQVKFTMHFQPKQTFGRFFQSSSPWQNGDSHSLTKQKIVTNQIENAFRNLLKASLKKWFFFCRHCTGI